MLERCIKLTLSAIPALLLFTGSGQSAETIDSAAIQGSCIKLAVGHKTKECTKLIYTHYPNGRTVFTAVTADGQMPVGFSSQKDTRTRLTSYMLTIDRLNTPEAPFGAQGYCTTDVSQDGTLVHSVTCSAVTEFGRIEMDFRGDGTPVEVTRLGQSGQATVP